MDSRASGRGQNKAKMSVFVMLASSSGWILLIPKLLVWLLPVLEAATLSLSRSVPSFIGEIFTFVIVLGLVAPYFFTVIFYVYATPYFQIALCSLILFFVIKKSVPFWVFIISVIINVTYVFFGHEALSAILDGMMSV